jgi:hypothetical protein
VSTSTEPRSPADRRRALRTLGAVVLLALQAGGVLAVLWARQDGGPEPVTAALGRGPAPDQVVTLEFFADDALVVTTERGLRALPIDAHTTVDTVGGPGRLADLRPGMMLVIWWRARSPGRAVVERLGLIGAEPGRTP